MNKIFLSNLINKKNPFITFSTFKNKFQILQTSSHENLSSMYNHMIIFENNLTNLEKLKYRKSLENIEKKANKLTRKQKSQQNTLQMNFLNPFNTSMSLQFFYKIENNQYQPINETMLINKINLKQLYNIIINNKLSTFYTNLQSINTQILSNPSQNQTLYNHIKTRCQFFQEQLCLNIYQNYQIFLQENQQSINQTSNKNHALQKLKNHKNHNIVYKKDLKFNLKNNLTPQEHLIASEIALILTKYGFTTQKTMMFSMKSLSNQGYQSLTPKSLKNHLFVLAYHQVQVQQINENLFKFYDLIQKQSKISNQNQHLGQIGPLNSLLFYMLSNKIQTYQIYKSITNSINQKAKKQQNLQTQTTSSICNIQKQIFLILISLLKSKYSLQINIPQIKTPKILSNSHLDFQKFLIKKQYIFNKIQNITNQSNKNITNQIIYEIDDKNFISFHLYHINKNNGKPNGIGQLLLEYFRTIDKNIKFINPFVISKCQKWTEKQNYFKTKLKGIQQPKIQRKKWYD